MTAPHSTRSERLLKGWIVAVSSTSLASASHGLAGGHLPHPMVWALCTALSALVCVMLAGRRLPKVGLATSVLLSQGLLHWLFSLQGLAVAQVPQTSGHLHHGSHLLGSSLAHSHAVSDNQTAMLAYHMLAAVLTFLLLRRGRALAHRANSCLGLALQAIFTLPGRLQIPAPVRTVAVQRRPLTNFLNTWLDSMRLLRGPPAVLFSIR